MKNKKLFLPAIILASAIVLTAICTLVINIALKPTITEAEFDFYIEYELDGERIVIDETYKAHYVGNGGYTGTKERHYSGQLGDFEEDSRMVTIKQEAAGRIEINTNIFADYMMGDAEDHDYFTYDPFEPQLLYYDAMEQEYSDAETLLEHGAKLISWEYPEPIENSFVFSHFSISNCEVVLPALLIALVAMIVTIIFVKKDADYVKKPLDVIATVFNYIVGIMTVPFFTIIAFLGDALGDNESFFSQVTYYVGAITILSIAASIALRRKGYKVIGFIIQFAGPVLFFVVYMISSIIWNIT